MRTENLFFLAAVTAVLFFISTGCGDSAPGPQPETSGAMEPAAADVAAVETPEVTPPADVPGQELCPVMGGKINRGIYADYKGRRVYFCCPPCVKTFESDPEKYLKALEEMKQPSAKER